MRIYIHTMLLGLSLMTMLFVMAGCKKQAAHSEAFTQIFKDETAGTLRGVDLGNALEEAKEKEGSAPKHDDQWGYVYEYSLGEKNRYFVEYICRDPQARKVNAMVVNVLLDDKATVTVLFSEIEDHLRNRYGVADGSVSNLKWRHEESNLIVSLRMLDDKKSISLSYGALASR
jgi:phenylpyruvate tautomerase PptA (4-oxalocrotonate tautomerase family)